MTTFEEELTELLDARAERVTVHNAAPEQAPALEGDSEAGVVIENVAFGSGALTSARSEKRRSGMTQWILAAAAALVVVVGVVALTRGSAESDLDVDVASEEAPTEEAAEDFVDATGTGSDLIVWLEPAIGQDQLDAVEEVLATREVVDSARYVDQADTLAEFQEYWVDSAEILAAVDADQLPTSYRVDFADDSSSESIADLVRELKGLDGVRDVATGDLVDPEPSSVDGIAPIYVLPPVGYDGMEFDGRAASSDDTPSIEAMVVGRATESGYTDLVVVELATERGFLSTTTVEIGGQEVEPFIDGDGLVARQVSDGDWLRFTSFRDDAFLDLVVPATSIEDGRIVFAGTDGFEVVTSAAPGHAAQTTTAVLGTQGPEMILTTAAVDGEVEAVFHAAYNGEDAERFDSGSLSGWFGRPSDASTTGGLTSFSWRITDDHVATVLMAGSDEAILAAVAGVRIVDEATWANAVGLADDALSGQPSETDTVAPTMSALVDRFTNLPPSAPEQVLVWMEADSREQLGGAAIGVSETIDALGLESTYRTGEMVEADLRAWAVEQGLEDALLTGPSPAQIPSLFQVTADDPVSLAYSVSALPGVRSVTLHPAWSASPLFLLPPPEVSLTGMSGFDDGRVQPETEGVPSEAIAVGRPTADGFDRLMAAAVLPEPEYGLEGETTLVGEREILVFADSGAPNLLLAAEQLADGRWLHFYVNDVDELRPFAESTSVGPEGLEFEPFEDVVELRRSADIAPFGRVVALSPPLDATEGFGITATVASDVALIVLATTTDSLQTVTVRGQTGWRTEGPSLVAGEGAAGDGVVWWEPTGHLVSVTTSEPGGAVAFAESLVAVDEMSWRAAVPEIADLN